MMAKTKILNPADSYSPVNLLAHKVANLTCDLGYGDLLKAWYTKYKDEPGGPEFILHKMLRLLLDLGHKSVIQKWVKEAKIITELQNEGHDTSNVTPLAQEGGAK